MSKISNVIKTKFYVVSFIAILSLVLVACGSDASENERGNANQVDTSTKNSIITSSYPVEFVVNEIVKDNFNVVNVTPVGTPAHDFELSPSSTQTILSAKLAIVLGEGFQPAIEDAAISRSENTLVIMEELESTRDHAQSMNSIVPARYTHNDDHDDDDHSHDGEDPHFWLDPILMKDVVDIVLDAIIEIDKGNEELYNQNAKALKVNLDKLDQAYQSELKGCEVDTFVTSHDAFSRLAQRYNLKQEPLAGFSPENEPSPERMAQIVNLVRSKNIDTVFTEELVSQRVADSLSREAGVKTKILSPLESLTQQQVDDDEDYFSIMNSNLVALRSALKCSSV